MICADLYFLVQWEEHDEVDGHDIMDVLPAKAIVAVDVGSLGERHKCQIYPVTIIGSGKWILLLQHISKYILVCCGGQIWVVASGLDDLRLVSFELES